jgi:hypothetical protein
VEPDARLPSRGKFDRDQAALVLAILASICGVLAFGRTLSSEWAFFSAHSSQKTLILRIPGELARTDREIVREQRELVRIQGEIRARIGKN